MGTVDRESNTIYNTTHSNEQPLVSYFVGVTDQSWPIRTLLFLFDFKEESSCRLLVLEFLSAKESIINNI